MTLESQVGRVTGTTWRDGGPGGQACPGRTGAPVAGATVPGRRATASTRRRRTALHSSLRLRLAREVVPDLGEPDVVPRRVAERGVDPVRALLRRLHELHPAALELLVGSVDVVCGQEDRPGASLGHPRTH